MGFADLRVAFLNRSRLLCAALVMTAAMPANGADGVLEINQTCAEGPGCFAGDSAGFPVQIANSGSYRLTGNLTVDDGATTVIRIFTAHVTIDLGGFTISGPAVCSDRPVTGCTNGGTGDGIFAAVSPNHHDITIKNGDIRGMGDDAIALGNIGNVHVDRIRAVSNAGYGFRLGPRSLVTNSYAHANLGLGISSGESARVSDSTFMHNGGTGMSLGGGTTIVTNCLTINNGNTGLSCGAADTDTCIIDGVISSLNANFGMTLGGDHMLLRDSNIASNTTGQVLVSGDGGYVGNVISGGSTVAGAGAIQLGLNLCNGDTNCP